MPEALSLTLRWTGRAGRTAPARRPRTATDDASASLRDRHALAGGGVRIAGAMTRTRAI